MSFHFDFLKFSWHSLDSISLILSCKFSTEIVGRASVNNLGICIVIRLCVSVSRGLVLFLELQSRYECL